MNEIAEHAEGITFNRLVERMRRRVSRMTVFRELKNLLSKGYIEIERDPRHKQRKPLRLREDLRKFMVDLKFLERETLGDSLQNLTGFLTSYIKKIHELKEEWMKDLARYRLRRRMDEILRKMEETICQQRSY